MIIRYITVRNFGSVGYYHTDLDSKLNLVDACCIPELLIAFQILLCSRTGPPVPAEWIRESTGITAGISLNNILCTASVAPHGGRLQLAVTDHRGIDVTEQYRYMLFHCPEQDATESFDGQDNALPLKLYRYRIRHKDDACTDLSDRTACLADTQSFRFHLHRYLKAFQPEPINCRKNYLAAVDGQGKFVVINPGISGEMFLSETERKLFLYICFLNIVEFWAEIEQIRDLHHEKKPLVIRNFLEYLDESADISSLIARTLKTGRQVILLTPPLDEEIKKEWMDQYNE